MPRVTNVLKNTRKVIEDSDLFKILLSEISHAQSCNTPSEYTQKGSLGDFVLEWDSLETRDVALKKKCESGEEVSVSALLDFDSHAFRSNYHWDAMMKVCIKRPGVSSLLQFDCCAYDTDFRGSKFDICEAYYLPSTTSLDVSIYRAPPFSSLDLSLQLELKNYLIRKGINEELTSFIVCYMQQKEQGQYINWLLKLKDMMKRNDDQRKTT